MKIYKFYSKTCSPCKILTEMINDTKIGETTDIDIDILDNIDIIDKYNIRAVPTLVKVNEEGKEIGKIVGIKPIEEIKKFFN